MLSPKRMLSFFTLGLLTILIPAPVAARLAPVNPAVQNFLDKTLPGYEKAAVACAKELDILEEMRGSKARVAVDGAHFRADLFLQARSNLKRDPKYLSYLTDRNLKLWLEGMEYFRDCARRSQDPHEGMVSGLRVVRSRIDGNLLFYIVTLPKGYDPARRYPLDVSLHSGASIVWRADRASWFGKPSRDPRTAREEPAILIDPCGRGNNCYVGMGQIAVLEAIDDVLRHYRIDEDRIVLGGWSMGGTGGYRMGAFHPDRFAAIYSGTGWPNYALPNTTGLYEPTHLLDNLRQTGVCLWYEPGDLTYQGKRIDINHRWIDGLKERAKTHLGHYPHVVFFDPKGGHGIIDRALQAEGWKWLRQQKRNPWPRHVTYKTYGLRYDGAYWARIDTVEDPGAPARIDAELQDAGKLRVAVENIDRFHLDLKKELVGPVTELEVRVNGEAPFKVSAGRTVYFARSGGRWGSASSRYPTGLVKKHGLSGPIADVFMGGPVLMVYGSGQARERSEQMVTDAVERLFGRGDGAGILHSGFERKADRDVTAQDIAGKHLVLFGTPQVNQVLHKLADRLPVRFLKEGVEVGGKAYQGADVGLVMVYPNPLNPDRYVLLLPENYGTYTSHPGALGANVYRFPDYVVGKPAAAWGGNTIQVLTQGSFDSNWRLRP